MKQGEEMKQENGETMWILTTLRLVEKGQEKLPQLELCIWYQCITLSLMIPIYYYLYDINELIRLITTVGVQSDRTQILVDQSLTSM